MRETLADLTDFSRFPPLSKVSNIPTNEMVKRTSTHFQDIPGRVSNLLASINSVPADGVDVSDYKYEEESEKAKIEQDNPAISCRLQAARVDQKASRCYNELLEKRMELPVNRERRKILRCIKENRVFFGIPLYDVMIYKSVPLFSGDNNPG